MRFAETSLQTRKTNSSSSYVLTYADEPFKTRYRLDSVRDDQDGSRRGLSVCIENKEALAKLKLLDTMAIATAVANSKEWFKKSLSEVEITARYKPIVHKAQEEDETECCKFKVKCGSSKFPTRLHLMLSDGKIIENGASLDDINKGSLVAPILSIFSVWFMGGGSSFGISMQAEEMIIQPGSVTPPLSSFTSKRSIECVTLAEMEEGDKEDMKVRRVEMENEEMDNV